MVKLLKAAVMVLVLLAVVCVVGYGLRAVRQALGLEADSAVRIAELAVEQAQSEAEKARALVEQAMHEHYEARAEAERSRQEVKKLATEGRNTVWRAVAFGYAAHVTSHTMLVFSLVGLAGLAFVGIGLMALVAWKSLG